MGVIPNPKMAFIFPISCILALIFPILIKYFPKCVGKGSFPKSKIKSLGTHVRWYSISLFECFDNHCIQNDFSTIEICTYYEKGMQ